jgi:hypothetical protein
VTESSEPLRPAFVDFWKRVLTDGYRLPRGSRTRLAIEMLSRRISADKTGKARAVFHRSLRSQSEGKETVPDDPLESLAGSVIDVPWMRLMEELCAAIIQYTLPHFKNIHCKITQGLQQGQRALFYDIRCPEFPDEDTTEPSARLHTAATRAVQHLSAEQGLFKGIVVQLNMQKDGTWLHSSKQI